MGVEAGVEVGAQAEAQAQEAQPEETGRINIIGCAYIGKGCGDGSRACGTHSTCARSQQHRKINSRLAEQQAEKEVRTMSSASAQPDSLYSA